MCFEYSFSEFHGCPELNHVDSLPWFLGIGELMEMTARAGSVVCSGGVLELFLLNLKYLLINCLFRCLNAYRVLL